MNYPYSDDKMIYDAVAHRYILTPDTVKIDLGIDLDAALNKGGDANPSTLPERFCRDVSTKFYDYVYQHSPQKNLIEYTLAKREECRNLIYQCLLNETRYVLKNGDFWNYAGVNLSKGQAIPLEGLRGRSIVSTETELALNQPLSDGFKLLYRGYYQFPWLWNFKWREDY
jgi:hypothetical protein